MPLIDRVFELIDAVAGLLFGTNEFKFVKLILVFFGLIVSLAFVGYWFFMESKYKWGRWWWGFLFNIWAEARIKPEVFQKEWKKLQSVYERDKTESLYKSEEILNALLDLYFYEEAPLTDRLEKTSKITIPNIERLKMANNAIELIKTRQKNGEKIEISEKEANSILKEFELSLLQMFIIVEEDCWVKSLEQPQQ
ncbi:MAG: hypothetical protein AAB371_02155 [Patescibacteria group bacterium]